MKEKINELELKIKLSTLSIGLFNFIFGISVVAYLIFLQKIQIAIPAGVIVLFLFYISFLSRKKIEKMFEKIEDEELTKEMKKIAKNKKINEVIEKQRESSKLEKNIKILDS
jgi:ABC-type multidrug transport system fused ATPase/permease subunit